MAIVRTLPLRGYLDSHYQLNRKDDSSVGFAWALSQPHSVGLRRSPVTPDLPGQPGLCATTYWGLGRPPIIGYLILSFFFPIWNNLRAPMMKEQDTSPKTDQPVHAITTLYSHHFLFYIHGFLRIRNRVSVLSSLFLFSILYHSWSISQSSFLGCHFLPCTHTQAGQLPPH